MTSLSVRKLLSEEANTILEKAYSCAELRSGIRSAFSEEIGETGRFISALPENHEVPIKRREYYLVSAYGEPELLVGINAWSNISSLAKVVPHTRSKCSGRLCVKKLIEDVLVTKDRPSGQQYIYVATSTKEGDDVFWYLQQHLPNGIMSIESTEHGFKLKVDRPSL